MWLAKIANLFAGIGSFGKLSSIWKWWGTVRSFHQLWKRVKTMWGVFTKAAA
ncbi:hypothetical protein [Salinithrix halophila]|uniref:Uncharacterized protein n=1 Tax=Salinithrix halophila TaxID=1485204 RepID=A0ABV8JEG6_9BACL